MNNRRNFLKKAGLGGLAIAGTSVGAMNNLTNLKGDELFVDNKVIQGEGKQVKIKVSAPLFCPFQSINGPGEKGGNSYYSY